MRALLLTILFVFSLSLAVTAQKTTQQDTTCNFLKDVKFSNGTAIVIVEGYYRDYHRSGDEAYIMTLAKEKKLRYSDYGTNEAGCSGVSFMPVGCNKRADGPINRKAKFNPDKVKEGNKIRITCLVFEDKNVRDRYGNYFFVITSVSTKNIDK